MKLQRYELAGTYDDDVRLRADGRWCESADVERLEASHQRLLDALKLVLENDMQDYKTADYFGGYVLDEDVRVAIQDAISKSGQ